MSAPLTMTLDLNQVLAPFIERIARLEAEIASVRSELNNRRPSLDPDELLTVEQAAVVAGVSAEAIYKRVARGKVPKHPIAGTEQYRVRRSDVEPAR